MKFCCWLQFFEGVGFFVFWGVFFVCFVGVLWLFGFGDFFVFFEVEGEISDLPVPIAP